jgi:hypothetical protein
VPQRASGEAVPNVAEAATKSWYVFKHFNPGSATDPRLSYVSGYRRCAADMLADLFEFGGWDVLTRRMLEVLEDLGIQREAVRMVTEDGPDE